MGKMFFIIVVHFAAMCSVVFTNQDSDTDQYKALDSVNIHTSFEFRDEHSGLAERSDASTIVSSFQKKRRCVNSEPSNLKLAAFNVRTFGTKKMATPGVPEILVKVDSAYFV